MATVDRYRIVISLLCVRVQGQLL